MTVYYLGADAPWSELRRTGVRRRNACLLEALGECRGVARVYNVNSVLRSAFFERLSDAWRDQADDRIRDVFVCTLLPERRWLPFTRALNRLLYRMELAIQTGRFVSRRSVVWSYWPDGFRLAVRLDLPGLWIFDADHNLLHDENRSAGEEAELETLLRAAAQKCDLVVAAAPSMLQWFRDAGAKTVARIRNGVDPAPFLPAKGSPSGGPPRIGYLGVLSTWVDYDLLYQVIAARPDWTFVVGGFAYRADASDSLKRLPNVQFLGKVDAHDVPALLATFDAALALYRPGPWMDGDSMKVFDYLAAGVPVISTRYHASLDADFEGLLQLADNAEEFVAGIEALLTRDPAAARAWHAHRRRFIEENTWAARATEAMGHLQQALGPAPA